MGTGECTFNTNLNIDFHWVGTDTFCTIKASEAIRGDIMNELGIVSNILPTWRNPGTRTTEPDMGLKQSCQPWVVQRAIGLLRIFVVLLIITATLISCESRERSEKSLPPNSILVRIGTGNVNGLYHHAGSAIAEVVNRKTKNHHVFCQTVYTGGSVDNFREIIAGNLEMGLGQSDLLYQAYNGQRQWRDKGPQADLRAILTLNKESVTLVAAVDAGINSITDLRGKTVNIGGPGSGERQSSLDALENVGIDYTKDLVAKEYKLAVVDLLLQDGKIDAFFHSAGHPSPVILSATEGYRKVRLASITGLDRLLRKYPYYVKAYIPIKFYPQVTNKADVETFAVKTTLVASAKVPDEVVYTITREVFENIDFIRKYRPTYETLTAQSMVECLAAPIHPGAKKYYDEVGLVPSCIVK
jgi:TRAP transporter TAXI family solute receptor